MRESPRSFAYASRRAGVQDQAPESHASGAIGPLCFWPCLSSVDNWHRIGLGPLVARQAACFVGGAARVPSTAAGPSSPNRGFAVNPFPTLALYVAAPAPRARPVTASFAHHRRTDDRTAGRVARAHQHGDHAGELIAAGQLAAPCTYPCGDCRRWCVTYGTAGPHRVGRVVDPPGAQPIAVSLGERMTVCEEALRVEEALRTVIVASPDALPVAQPVAPVVAWG